MHAMHGKTMPPNRQHGIAAVEFAIALPILVMLMLATVEFGRALSQYNTLTKTTRDGVRYLSGKALLGSTGVVIVTPTLRTETQNLVVYGNASGIGDPVLDGLTASQVEVIGSAAESTVTVNAAYPYQPMIGAAMPKFGFGSAQSLTFTLRSSVNMRAL